MKINGRTPIRQVEIVAMGDATVLYLLQFGLKEKRKTVDILQSMVVALAKEKKDLTDMLEQQQALKMPEPIKR